MSKPTLIVITGPTASGKSALAVSLAKRLQTDIISADSRQIYKGIPIVTAVPSIQERAGVPHHLLEVLDLEEYYSAAKFQEDSSGLLEYIFREKDCAIVCGGSMLYIDALTKGIDNLPTVPPEVRESLQKEWEDKGDGWLLAMLKQLDPQYYLKVDLRNLKRIFHAVELSLTAGVPYSSMLNKNIKAPQDYSIVKFCLNGNRDALFDRINRRVDSMISVGLEEEAFRVYSLRHLNSLNTVGLKEMFSMFRGDMTREEAVARIKKNTRVYAKKQLTWHKRDPEMNYLDLESSILNNTERIIQVLQS